MWPTLQYLHLLESICMTWYSEHGINNFFKNFVFHCLQYYYKMIASIVFLLDFVKAMQYPSKFQKIYYGTQKIYEIPLEGYYMWIE